jgi:8-oxo-dGTP pyrophosphatase MutT (NUDIX family)
MPPTGANVTIQVAGLLKALVPAPLHRALLWLASRALRTTRRLIGRRPTGCAMIIHDDDGRILLVRHSYIEPNTWMLPSGRIGRSENPLGAAAREVREEAQIQGLDIGMIEFEENDYWGFGNRTFIVGGRASGTVEPDGREIIAAQFFDPHSLPEDTSLPTVERIKRWSYRRSLPVVVPPFVRPQYVAGRRFRDGRRLS